MRNAQTRFALNPTSLDVSRSRMDRSSSVKLSFNVGELIPFYVDEVLPGDTFDVSTSKVIRLQTLLTPMMDNLYLDTYFFFVPNRLVWDHWKEFQGENTQSAWLPETEYSIPTVESPATGWNIGTVADYMGIPTGKKGLQVNALPLRGYAKVCDDWFRDQNLMDPIAFPTDDSTVQGVNTGVYQTDMAKGGKPFIAAKMHDVFTSCLPSPQKGPDVNVPIGSWAPVLTRDVHVGLSSGAEGMQLAFTDLNARTGKYPLIYDGTGVGPGVEHDGYARAINQSVTGEVFSSEVLPSNLWANLANASAATVNQLRMAFQVQRYYEKLARGGSRYVEILKNLFGVTSPDASLQRSQYLGGNRIPITVNQVIQQSGTGDMSYTPQGTVTGMSLTTDNNSDFVQSFTEHGFIIGLCVARYPHTYQQGLERMWSRRTKFDYYIPVFANIGEQAVKNIELYATGDPEKDNLVFGYQEAWYDYRYKPNRVAGEMRSDTYNTLDCWHLADHYTTTPILSDSWIVEDKNNVDRCLAVQSNVANQLFMDVYIKNLTTRIMPMYSIPGLIDHH